MFNKAQFIAEAREWIGTKFHHQAAVKGVGCDCIGLIRGVKNQLIEDDILATLDYSMQPNNFRFYNNLEKHPELEPTNVLEPGILLLFKFIREPQHIAIYTDKNTIIHSYQPRGQVVEHRLDDKWKDRIHSMYKVKGCEDV